MLPLLYTTTLLTLPLIKSSAVSCRQNLVEAPNVLLQMAKKGEEQKNAINMKEWKWKYIFNVNNII